MTTSPTVRSARVRHAMRELARELEPIAWWRFGLPLRDGVRLADAATTRRGRPYDRGGRA